MDDIKRLINSELDPNFQENRKELKQKRGFVPEGKKILELIECNTVNVYEVSSGAEYIIDYLGLISFIEVMGFDPNKLGIAKSKLFSGKPIIIDFDTKKILIYDKKEKPNIIGGYLFEGKELWDETLEN